VLINIYDLGIKDFKSLGTIRLGSKCDAQTITA
jgi:hypothetical protein